MDRGETGGERPKGELDVHGIDAACLVPVSRINDLQGFLRFCDDTAKPGDCIVGDVTALESEKQNQRSFPFDSFSTDRSHWRLLL